MTTLTTDRPLWEALIMDAIGERIASYRRRRGLSQTVVAGLIGRSESWLSQVERGKRTVDSLSVLLELSRVLDVSVDALVGTPVAPIDALPHPETTALRYVKTALHQHTALTGMSTPSDPAEVTMGVAGMNTAYQGADYEQVLDTMPALIALLEQLPLDASTLAVEGWVVCAKTLTKLGEDDLARMTAERAAAAARAGTARARGLAARQLVDNLQRRGDPDTAQSLALDTVEALAHDPQCNTPDVLSLRGSLLLLAAVIAAKRTRRFEALQLLDQAEQLAAQLGVDANHAWTAFGPTNVKIHAVSIAAALGDAAEALRVAETIDTDQLPPLLASRRAQLHVDLAWAYCTLRRDSDAILALLEVENVAPGLIRHHHACRYTLNELLNRARSAGPGTILGRLAQRAGLVTESTA